MSTTWPEWLHRVPVEYPLRAQVNRMTSCMFPSELRDRRVFITAGVLISVHTVRSSDRSAGRSLITFEDREFGKPPDELHEQEIVTDWLSGGWEGMVARYITDTATKALGRRAKLWQLNEHFQGEPTPAGTRRVVWLEPLAARNISPE